MTPDPDKISVVDGFISICHYCNSPLTQFDNAGACRCIMQVEENEMTASDEVIQLPCELKDFNDNHFIAGSLYRHYCWPSIWRYLGRSSLGCRMKLVWYLGDYARQRKIRINQVQLVTNQLDASAYVRCDLVWLGQVFMELRDFIVDEFSYEERS